MSGTSFKPNDSRSVWPVEPLAIPNRFNGAPPRCEINVQVDRKPKHTTCKKFSHPVSTTSIYMFNEWHQAIEPSNASKCISY